MSKFKQRITGRIGLIILLFFSVDLIVVGQDSSSNCFEKPETSAFLKKLATYTFQTSFQIQGKVKYDPNPPHSFSFSEHINNSPLKAFRDILEEPIVNIPYFLNSYSTTDRSLVPIPRELFWCLLRPASTVLLFDGATAHYTTVYSINSTEEYIDFIDPWPDMIFLKNGLNLKNIEAQIITIPDKGKVVRITKDELERVIIAANAFESPSFLPKLVGIIPGAAKNPKILLSIAHNIFGEENSETPIEALPNYSAALAAVLDSDDSELQLEVAKEALYALRFSELWLMNPIEKQLNEEAVSNDVLKLRKFLKTNFPQLSIVNDLTEPQLLRLGQISWQKYLYEDAQVFFQAIINKNPQSAEGFFGLAKVSNRKLDHERTILSVKKTLELIEKKLDEEDFPQYLEDGSNAYEMINFFRSAPERKELSFMIGECYFLRGNAYNGMGKFEEARRDGMELIAFDPNDYQGYLVVATSLVQQELDFQALPYYEQAIALCRNPDLKKNLQNIKIQVEAKAIAASQKELDRVRTLVKKNPGNHEAELAEALMNIGKTYYSLYRDVQASKAYKEALKIYRTLEENSPKHFEGELAFALKHLGAVNKSLNLHSSAVSAYEEAVKLYKSLYTQNPDTFKVELGFTLKNLGGIYNSLHQYSKSIETLNEALNIFKALSENDPDYYMSDLVSILNDLGRSYFNLNRYNEASKVYNESLMLNRDLFTLNPNKYCVSFGNAYYNLGSLYKNKLDFSLARGFFTKADSIYNLIEGSTYADNLANKARAQILALEAPTALAEILENKGNSFYQNGQMDSARYYWLNTIQHYEELLSERPDIKTQKDISIVYENLAFGEKSKKKQYMYQKEAIKYRKVAYLENPDNLKIKEDLALAYFNLSWYALFVKAFSESEQSARKTLELSPANKGVISNLAAALLFSDKTKESMQYYKDWKDKPWVDDSHKTFKEVFLSDLDELEAANITHHNVKKVRKLLRK